MSETALAASDIDARRFRDTLGHYASGITVVTAHDGTEPVGFTCQSFYSVSIEPPLVSFSVMKTSSTYPQIRDIGRFAVNVLSRDQARISSQFARRGDDRWRDVTWEASRSGNPVIAETLMWLDCESWAEFDAGDHWIVVGRVRELSPERWHEGEPLLFFKGRYRHLRDADGTV